MYSACVYPILLAVCLTVLSGGCSELISKDPASPYSLVPVGSELDILRTIEVPPGRTRVFFQSGWETANFDHYVPSCNIEVRILLDDTVQYVAPGVYRVERVQRYVEEIVHARRIELAAVGEIMTGLGDGGEGNTMIYDGYHLWLNGDDKNLMRLSCRGVYADLVDARPPGLNEIRAVLGESMELHLIRPQELKTRG